MKFLHLIAGNFRRHKLRATLTLLSIVVAFVLFGLLCAIQKAIVGGVTLEGANRLVVRHKVSIIQSLPRSYQPRIERIPGVVAATHLSWFGGVYQEPKNFFPQMPVVPEEFLNLHPEFLVTPEVKQKWLQTRIGAIVGRKTADRFHWKVGDRIPLQGTIYPRGDGSQLWEFEIVGFYDGEDKNTDTTSMYFRYDYFDEARPYAKGEVGWFVIRVGDPSRAAEVAKAVDEEFTNSAAETKTETEGAFIQGFANQVGNIAMITAAILSAVFFTLLLVTGNTMALSVRERTGELGVLKAIGFTNLQVLGLVLAESCLLAIVGGGLGLGLAWMLVAKGDPTGGMLPLFHFPLADLVKGIVLIILLGLVTGLMPAWQAMRLRVADAVRRM